MTSQFTPQTVRRALAAVLAVLALAAAACTSGDETQPETTTTSAVVEASTTTTVVAGADDQLVFGNGAVPETVPASFPIPEEANVGATMVDRVNGVTEVIVVFPAHIEDVVDYYETNLDALGYTVDLSEGEGARWTIALTAPDGDITGEILMEAAGTGITQAVMRILEPTDS